MSLAEILSVIAKRTGLPLSLGETGSCILGYGEGLEMVVASVDHDQSVLLYQELVRVTPADGAGLLRRCMVLNVYGTQTGGLTLGLDPESDYIVLSRRLPVSEADPDRLTAWISAFMTVAQHHIEVLSTLDASTVSDGSSLEPDAIRA